jgi:hypothetical protein
MQTDENARKLKLRKYDERNRTMLSTPFTAEEVLDKLGHAFNNPEPKKKQAVSNVTGGLAVGAPLCRRRDTVHDRLHAWIYVWSEVLWQQCACVAVAHTCCSPIQDGSACMRACLMWSYQPASTP